VSAYLEDLRKHRRLVILRILSELPTNRANASLLRAGVESVGVPSTRDDMTTDIQWLVDQSLVTSEQHVSVQLVTITARGDDVANGRAIVPGVARPSPK
jgi:hypothetical protein